MNLVHVPPLGQQLKKQRKEAAFNAGVISGAEIGMITCLISC